MTGLTFRQRMTRAVGILFGGSRDLYETFGYQRDLTVDVFYGLYQRGDIAARIVDAFPDATWREQVTFEDCAPAFVSAWQEMEKRLNLWRQFHRLDRLTGIGHYGVLVLGLDGRENPADPVTPGKKYRLLYVQPHSERTAQVSRWEAGPTSPRYGKPVLYQVTIGNSWTGAGGGQKVLQVHHSRVIHVAERELEDSSIGLPRLERIYNRLMDLEKMVGGTAEIFWQNAAALMAYIADKDLEWNQADRDAVKAQVEEVQHGLRRALTLQGIDAKNLAPGMMGSDTSNAIDKVTDLIAGASGIPKRVLLGTERGELASSQDENNFSARVVERREQFAGPQVLDQFIARGQRLGFLPDGFGKYWWPESDTLGEEKRAQVATQKVTALVAYANAPAAWEVVDPVTVRGWLGETGPLPALPGEPGDLDESDPETLDQFGNGSATDGSA